MKSNFSITGEYITNWIRCLYFMEGYTIDECSNKLTDILMMKGEESIDIKDIIIGKKKLTGTTIINIVEDKEFDIYKRLNIEKPKFNKKGEGIIGILTRCGIFAQCRYGEHDATIALLKEKSEGALIFGVTSLGSYMIKDKEDDNLSYYQLNWIKENIEYLDEIQKILIEKYL